MGLLDEAIREHLELKRRHGADEDEVARQEAEAFGPEPIEEEEEPFAGFEAAGDSEVEEDSPDLPFDRAGEAGLTGSRDLPEFEWHGSRSDDIEVPSYVLEEPDEGQPEAPPEPAVAEAGEVDAPAPREAEVAGPDAPGFDRQSPNVQHRPSEREQTEASEPPAEELDEPSAPSPPKVTDAPTEAFTPVDVEPAVEPPPALDSLGHTLPQEEAIRGELSDGLSLGEDREEFDSGADRLDEAYDERSETVAREEAEPYGPAAEAALPAELEEVRPLAGAEGQALEPDLAEEPPHDDSAPGVFQAEETELEPPYPDAPAPSLDEPVSEVPAEEQPPPEVAAIDQPTEFMSIEEEALYEPAAEAEVEARGEPLDFPAVEPDPLVEESEEDRIAPDPLAEDAPLMQAPQHSKDAPVESEAPIEEEPLTEGRLTEEPRAEFEPPIEPGPIEPEPPAAVEPRVEDESVVEAAAAEGEARRETEPLEPEPPEPDPDEFPDRQVEKPPAHFEDLDLAADESPETRSARGFFEDTQQHEGIRREQREGRDPDFEG